MRPEYRRSRLSAITDMSSRNYLLMQPHPERNPKTTDSLQILIQISGCFLNVR
jgi:hypothetical protein